MRIVCGLDVHRRQITYAIVDVRSGELARGRITPATRESVREPSQGGHLRQRVATGAPPRQWRAPSLND